METQIRNWVAPLSAAWHCPMGWDVDRMAQFWWVSSICGQQQPQPILL